MCELYESASAESGAAHIYCRLDRFCSFAGSVFPAILDRAINKRERKHLHGVQCPNGYCLAVIVAFGVLDPDLRIRAGDFHPVISLFHVS